MEYAFGTWYVRGGGLRELARAVYERCLARRVEFRFGAEVTGIVEKDGRVAGVELGRRGRWRRPSSWSPASRRTCWTASCGGPPVRGDGRGARAARRGEPG
ncbi:hypothetical protein SCYAM73S_03247 [Streptomyces cyaneofuscatus]